MELKGRRIEVLEIKRIRPITDLYFKWELGGVIEIFAMALWY